MPRLLVRQEPPSDDEPLGLGHTEPWCDGLLVEGQDRAAARRAHIGALNAGRQAADRANTWSVRRSGVLPAEDDGLLPAMGE